MCEEHEEDRGWYPSLCKENEEGEVERRNFTLARSSGGGPAPGMMAANAAAATGRTLPLQLPLPPLLNPARFRGGGGAAAAAA